MVDFRKKLQEKQAGKKKTKDELPIFEILDAICYTKADLTGHPLFKKSYSQFRVNRWLSMSPHTMWAAFFADQTRNLTDEQHFKFVQGLVERKKLRLTWKGGEKANKDAKLVQEYFQIGENHASQIVDILNRDQLRMMKDSFGGRSGK